MAFCLGQPGRPSARKKTFTNSLLNFVGIVVCSYNVVHIFTQWVSSFLTAHQHIIGYSVP